MPLAYLLLFLALVGCQTIPNEPSTVATDEPFVLILGTAQDGGYPQAGCQRTCCQRVWQGETAKATVVSLAIVSPTTRQWWLFEATPDLKEQLHFFRQQTEGQYNYLPDGIFLTHAHVGHYAGLIHLGREIMGADRVPVYVLPRMASFLETNGPWDQLIQLENIQIKRLRADSAVRLNEDWRVTAYQVPHRDEYSETAGFVMARSDQRYLFLPDIDKWEKWDQSINNMVRSVDVALLDATFFADGELPNRPMSEIPHPFVMETLARFAAEPDSIKKRIEFIHFNHTNPVLQESSPAVEQIREAGFNVAQQGENHEL